MTDKELENIIESSPKLRRLQTQLLQEVQFRVDDSVGFDPMTILMIISVMIQVVTYCRSKRSDEDIIADIQDIRTVPPRRLMRLRRKLNALWRNCCADRHTSNTDMNPLLTAVYEVAETTDVSTLKELIALARADN